ncbi:MAG: transposase [candidate division WOR-3 bacterium]|nr:transposase [candidate division WOR-3 bacterium]
MIVCGIDPCRSSFAVSFVKGMDELAYKEYDNSPSGFKEFIKDIEDLQEETAASIEGHGDFAKQLALHLQHASIKVYEINPKMSRALKGGFSIHKTDHIDAYVCAIAYQIRDLEPLNLDEELEGLKNLCRSYYKIRQTVAALKNRLHSELNQCYGKVYKQIFSEFGPLSLSFYSEFSSLKELQDSTGDDIFNKVFKESNCCRYKGKYGRKKAKEIKALADSIDVSKIDRYMEISKGVVKEYAELLILLEKSKQRLMNMIREFVNDRYGDYKEYFKGLKGMTPLMFGCLISEGLLTREFKTDNHLASYAGQAPKQVQSADKNSFKSHKNYNKYLACTIHSIALDNVGKDGIYHEEYKRRMERYSKKLRALKTIKRKFVRVLFYGLMNYRAHLLEQNLTHNKSKNGVLV